MALACQWHSVCFYYNPVLMILHVSSKWTSNDADWVQDTWATSSEVSHNSSRCSNDQNCNFMMNQSTNHVKFRRNSIQSDDFLNFYLVQSSLGHFKKPPWISIKQASHSLNTKSQAEEQFNTNFHGIFLVIFIQNSHKIFHVPLDDQKYI